MRHEAQNPFLAAAPHPSVSNSSIKTSRGIGCSTPPMRRYAVDHRLRVNLANASESTDRDETKMLQRFSNERLADFTLPAASLIAGSRSLAKERSATEPRTRLRCPHSNRLTARTRPLRSIELRGPDLSRKLRLGS
jgi:hypothetical protein